MAREGGACRDAHVVEDVAQVGLGRLLAQGQFRGDLRVGLAVASRAAWSSGSVSDSTPAPSVVPGRVRQWT
jgi:hypothetical protein